MRSDRFRALLYSFLNIFVGFKKNLFLHTISIFTVWICFFVLGNGLNVFYNVRSLLNLSKLRTHVSVYLKQEIEGPSIQEFREKYCKRPFVDSCSYISPDAAREKFIQRNPDLNDSVSILSENPFPPSMEIDFEKDFKTIVTLKDYSAELQKDANTLHVDDGGKWVVNWLQILNLFDRLTYVLGIAFSLMVAFVISNTIKLLVYSRKDEVEILALVGATRNMIRFPFLVEGVLHGVLGSLLSLVTLKFMMVWVSQYLHQIWPGFLLNQLVFLPWIVQVNLVVLGAIIGFGGSYLAVGKFLK